MTRRPEALMVRSAWRPMRLLLIPALLASPALGASSPPKPSVVSRESCALTVQVRDDGARPIPGANVLVQPNGGQRRSDAKGEARFQSVSCGALTVEVGAAGFETRKSPIASARGAAARSTQVVLQRTVIALAAQPKSDAVEKRESHTPRGDRGKIAARPIVRTSSGRGMVLMGYGSGSGGGGVGHGSIGGMAVIRPPMVSAGGVHQPEAKDREGYGSQQEEPFCSASDKPLSTFSIDVDTASWSNIRRFVERQGQLPPAAAVRIEEIVNAFPYSWAGPTDDHPFAVHTEVSIAPWNPAHRLMAIAVQGRRMETRHLPPANLVFLIDVSGSMGSPDRLPLVQSALSLLVRELRPEDRVSIVVYAGAAGLVLPPTSGTDQVAILDALSNLHAGGSTAGGAGIQLAYTVARNSFVKGGNNRVILATDGDFNVGASSDGELVRMIEEERKSGVFLTILGFGTGNYQDEKMQQLAQHGNGNHAYIDSLVEARRALVEQMGGTLLTIAKDVKIQVEPNPRLVKGYRLIGYDNRRLATRDFADDKKDAGELGAGHTVTALYEIIPAGSAESLGQDAGRKYTEVKPTTAATAGELATVRLRYKAPQGDTSQLIEHTVRDEATPLDKTSSDFRFATAAVELGLLLSGSKFAGQAALPALIARAGAALGDDKGGHRKAFIDIARRVAALRAPQAAAEGGQPALAAAKGAPSASR